MKFPDLIYDSPVSFSVQQRLKLAIVPPAISTVYKIITLSCKRTTRNRAFMDTAIEQYGRVIVATWHEYMGVLLFQHRNSNLHSVASYSFDGELGARVARCYGVETVRGSSSRGGSEALQQLEKALRQVPQAGFTLDGPRGPRRVAKPGVAILSARTQTPIIPSACAVSKAWRTRSWDRFLIPKPGAEILYDFAPPILPPKNNSAEAIEHTRLEVETTLNALHKELADELGADEELA